MPKKKKVKATELKNVRVSYVSYVKNPATDIKFDIIKDKNNEIIEDECYTDIINKSESTEKKSKKTFKAMLLNLNPFKKGEDKLNEEDKIFIKEVGGMSIAKKIQDSLDNISKRLIKLENGKNDTSVSLEALKKEVEGKEGVERENLEAEIMVKEKLSALQNTIANYENEIQEIGKKIEDADEDDVATLKSIQVDKETLVTMLKEREEIILNEVKKLDKSETDNTDADTKTPDNKTNKDKDTGKDNELNEKMMSTLDEVAKRLEVIENKRDKSNKMNIEVDKAEFENGEMDSSKDAFWKDAF